MKRKSPVGTSVTISGEMWSRAAAFAARRHHGQMRRDGRTPYFAHVARVALTVSEVFGCHDEEALAAALLHDLIEDTTTDYEDILEPFGKSVADMVAALTKNMALPEAAREKEYDRRIARADWRVRLIKLADVYDNLLDSANDPRGQTELPRRLDACHRAIALAARDVQGRPQTRSAIERVRSAMKKAAG